MKLNLKKVLLNNIFPHLKLKQNNITIKEKIIIYLNLFIQGLVILWIFTYLFSFIFYEYKYKYENFVFYTNKEIKDNNGSTKYLKEVHDFLRTNKIFNSSSDIEFYIVNNENIYSFINPMELLPSMKTYAVTLGNKVYVKRADEYNNLIYADKNDNKPESLNAILIHESLHVFQEEKYGWFHALFRIPRWVKEGYPIYSARSLSVYLEKDLVDFLKRGNINVAAWSNFIQDQFYSLMVKHAIEKLDKSVDDLHLGKVSYDEVYESLLNEYNIINER